MTAKLRAYLILGAVFVLGVTTGAGAMYSHGRHGQLHFDGPHGRLHLERRVVGLTNHLKLSKDQVTQVTAILERYREPRQKLIRETMDRCGEPLRKLRATADGEIRAILTPEQQQQFDELLRSRDSSAEKFRDSL